LLTPDKLDLKITCKLFIKLVLVLKTNFLKAFIILTNGYVPFDLINNIFIANKELFFLKDKRAKVIRGN
jgi:hypothetical protein